MSPSPSHPLFTCLALLSSPHSLFTSLAPLFPSHSLTPLFPSLPPAQAPRFAVDVLAELPHLTSLNLFYVGIGKRERETPTRSHQLL